MLPERARWETACGGGRREIRAHTLVRTNVHEERDNDGTHSRMVRIVKTVKELDEVAGSGVAVIDFYAEYVFMSGCKQMRRNDHGLCHATICAAGAGLAAALRPTSSVCRR